MINISRSYIEQNTTKVIEYTTLVGIMLDRNIALISSIYNCYKCGITYVPIDPNWPNARISDIISTLGITTLITTNKYKSKIKSGIVIEVNDNDIISFSKCNTSNPISYIMFTSGSTGKPKGVKVKKSALVNLIAGITSIIDFSKLQTILCVTSACFDIFFVESTMALLLNKNVVLADTYDVQTPNKIINIIENGNIDVIQMTPSRLLMINELDPLFSCLRKIKCLMVGGEPFPQKLLTILRSNVDARIYNMYGPTETTVWSTISDLTNKTEIDVGVPIKNTRIYILDNKQMVLENGIKGEIGIAGDGIADGYWGQDNLTKEKFITLPQNPNETVYLTGDLGVINSDGMLECCGRVDNQIKIRGYRVELEEIEKNIEKMQGVKRAIAKYENGYLVAFYQGDLDITDIEIRRHLTNLLPDYMIPQRYVKLDKFKYNLNGKIDRKALSLEMDNKKSSAHLQESNNLDDAIIAIIEDVIREPLDYSNTDIEFCRLGIDSIKFVSIVVCIENKFGFEFDDEQLLATEYDTLYDFICYVKKKIHG